MELVGNYYYTYNGDTYNVCYKSIINKNSDSVQLVLCNDSNITISNFNPNNAFWGYTLQDDGTLNPVVPMKYYDFQFIMGLSGAIFGALLFYAFINIFTRLKN